MLYISLQHRHVTAHAYLALQPKYSCDHGVILAQIICDACLGDGL